MDSPDPVLSGAGAGLVAGGLDIRYGYLVIDLSRVRGQVLVGMKCRCKNIR